MGNFDWKDHPEQNFFYFQNFQDNFFLAPSSSIFSFILFLKKNFLIFLKNCWFGLEKNFLRIFQRWASDVLKKGEILYISHNFETREPFQHHLCLQIIFGWRYLLLVSWGRKIHLLNFRSLKLSIHQAKSDLIDSL